MVEVRLRLVMRSIRCLGIMSKSFFTGKGKGMGNANKGQASG